MGRSDRSWWADRQFGVTGLIAGATIGANFQTDAFVFGAEADFDGSLMDGKTSSPFCSTGTQCETKTRWLSTLRGRLGYAADRVLVYGTAGGALGDLTFLAAKTTASPRLPQ